jgi:hypothetical protein
LILGGGHEFQTGLIFFGDLGVDFLAEDFDDLNPLLIERWVPDNKKVFFGVGFELEDRFNGESLIGESDGSIFSTDCVIINPSVEASGVRAVVGVGDKGTKEVDSPFFTIFDIDFDVAEVDISVLSEKGKSEI